DTLNSTDSICPNAVWKNSGYFLDYNMIFGDSIDSYFHVEWNNLQNKYVGLKIVHSSDSTLGWVQVFAKDYGGTFLTIKNYGCDSITAYIPPSLSPVPKSSGVIVFPNPTYDYVNIYLPNDPEYEIKLFNAEGQIVYQNYGNQKLVDLTGMSPGIYIIKIQTPDRIIKEKIIKQRKPG
ncbi:MAG: T9SS type A sorting domain-containing protein, partial [Bacteroidia bacterium]